MSKCFGVTESNYWRKTNPTGPVRWNGFCSHCGLTFENKPFSKGSMDIQSDGITFTMVQPLVLIVDKKEVFISKKGDPILVCSACVTVEKAKD